MPFLKSSLPALLFCTYTHSCGVDDLESPYKLICICTVVVASSLYADIDIHTYVHRMTARLVGSLPAVGCIIARPRALQQDSKKDFCFVSATLSVFQPSYTGQADELLNGGWV